MDNPVHPETRRRQAAELKGRRAERVAILWLRLKGYRLLARRHKTPVGEIDLILRRGKLLCFVEVKARSDAAQALLAVTPDQARRIARAASLWIGANPQMATLNRRFDVMAVTGAWTPPIHFQDVWRPDPDIE